MDAEEGGNAGTGTCTKRTHRGLRRQKPGKNKKKHLSHKKRSVTGVFQCRKDEVAVCVHVIKRVIEHTFETISHIHSSGQAHPKAPPVAGRSRRRSGTHTHTLPHIHTHCRQQKVQQTETAAGHRHAHCRMSEMNTVRPRYGLEAAAMMTRIGVFSFNCLRHIFQ